MCLSIQWKLYKSRNSNRESPPQIHIHYHPKYTLITLAPVSYLRSLVVRAVHRHRTGVGSIPAAGPIVDEFFSTVPG